jgi:hypothetical protein
MRGVCDTCGGSFKLTPSGNVVNHPDPFNAKNLCKGSNRPPEYFTRSSRI